MSVETRMLRTIYKADKLATLAETLDAKGKGNPAVGKAGDAFSAQLKNNLGKIPELEAQLQKNPALAGKIEALVLKDPQAFERAIPAILKNPNAATAEIDKASRGPAAPAATADVPKPAAPSGPQSEPVAVAAAAPRVEPVPATPLKAEAPAAEKPSEQPSPAAVAAAPVGTGPSAGSPPSNFTGRAKTTEEKIAELQTQPGFDDLMTVVGKNEHMRQALQNGMNQKDPNAPNALVDAVYDQVLNEKSKSPPNNNFLKQTAERLEKMPPGMQSTFGKVMADSPNAGMALFKFAGPLMEGENGNSLLGEGSAIGNALQSLLPMLAQLMEMFMGKSVKDLAGSLNVLATGKPELTGKALKVTGANPEVTMVDTETGSTTQMSGEEAKAGPPGAPAYNPENRPENRPGASPGPQFQPS